MTSQGSSSKLDKIIAIKGQNVLLNLRLVDISTIDPDRLLERGLWQISQVTENPYSLFVLPANNLNISLYKMGSIYSKLPRQVRKNLKCLYLLEPSWSLRMYFNVLIFMASPKFFKKIKWVNDRFMAPYFYTFGVGLEVVMTDQLILPRVVKDSITVISRNIQVIGLFRITPSVKLLSKVKEAYNYGDPEELALDVLDDVHLACSLLKLFVRELPEPVFGTDLYSDLKELLSCVESNMTLSIQTNILKRLRKPEFLLFKTIMNLLHGVHSKSDVNKMNAKNLCLVWSPNFIKTPKDDYDHIKHNTVLKGFSLMLTYCVENYNLVFEK